MNVKCHGEGRAAGLLGGLSSSSYKGAYSCVTPVGGDEEIEHGSVESLNIRLSLETRECAEEESSDCIPVDSASPFAGISQGIFSNAASVPSGDSGPFFDFPADLSFFPAFGYALTSPLDLAASKARIASSSERKL